MRQRREVTISVCLPARVTVTVERADEDGDWEVKHVRDVHCETTPRGLMEAIDEETLDDLYKRAEAAKDLK